MNFLVVPSGSRVPTIHEAECPACKVGVPYAPGSPKEEATLAMLSVMVYPLTWVKDLKARIIPTLGGPRLVVYAPDKFHRFYGAEGYTPLELVKAGVSLNYVDPTDPHPTIVPARIPLRAVFR